MTTLLHDDRPVHLASYDASSDLEIDLDTFFPTPDEEAEAANLFALAGPDGEADPMGDVSWLLAEKAHLERPITDPAGAHAFASAIVWDVVLGLRFHGHDSAAGYLADPNTRHDAATVAAVRIPDAGQITSRLAIELASLASYYLHLDTTVASLVAHDLLERADEAEALGADDFDQYERREALSRLAEYEDAFPYSDDHDHDHDHA